jgi:hypothetical protein
MHVGMYTTLQQTYRTTQQTQVRACVGIIHHQRWSLVGFLHVKLQALVTIDVEDVMEKHVHDM